MRYTAMENPTNDQQHFYETLKHPYLYAFWRQADANSDEVKALHRIDRDLRRGTLEAAAERLAREDFWRMGPFMVIADADMVEAELRAAGFRVERKLQ